MQDVMRKIRDASVRCALDHAQTIAEQVGCERLCSEANKVECTLKRTLHAQLIATANDGTPLMVVAIMAHIVSNTETSPVAIHDNVISLENVPTTIIEGVKNLEFNIIRKTAPEEEIE